MLSDAVQADVLTVTEYSARLGRALRQVGGALIEGEAQKPRRSSSGTLWFSLTDGEAVLPCKVFRGQARALEHVPREGDLVQVAVERPDLWPQAGRLDLIVGQVRLAGEGELLRRRRQLIERLTADGLCDPRRRRPLPRFPRAVGVIAGKDSDAMSDVIQALSDRWPSVHIVSCPALVQGKRAPRDLIDALAHMAGHPLVEVVIVARGGGSVQDLACFDEESLCRALFACELPVVCAIGHTENNPVCNHVAWAAYTPSRSAELVVPSAIELRAELTTIRERVTNARGRLHVMGERLELFAERINCAARLQACERDTKQLCVALRERAGLHLTDRVLESIGHYAASMLSGSARAIDRATRDVAHACALVAEHDFRARGWLLATDDEGLPIRSAADLRCDQRISLQLHDGSASAVIATVEHEETESP